MRNKELVNIFETTGTSPRLVTSVFIMADHVDIRNIPENALKMFQMQYQKAWKAYSAMLLRDPAVSTRIEALLRISSYVIPGRFVASEELGELLYGLSNLLSLLHDSIFRSNLKLPKYAGSDQESQLLLYLSVAETVEVFLEMAAERVWGEIGKWLVVVVIQLCKVALRILLLYAGQPKLQKYPLIPLLNRHLIFQATRNRENSTCDEVQSENVQREVELEESEVTSEKQHVWKGKRSGRFVRSLAASPPSGFRSWKLPQSSTSDETPTELTKGQFIAEVLYVIRPVLHLPSMFIFGEKSWKPWFLACLADMASLSLHTKCNPNLTALEKTEVSRRMAMMMMYLLRSPFYDQVTKVKIITFLNALSQNVPFVSVVIRPLLGYLPLWQRTYFYNWCS